MQGEYQVGMAYDGVPNRDLPCWPSAVLGFTMAKGKDNKGKGAATERVIENRKARHDYSILDTLEAGMVLRGSEIKSIRDGKVSLAEGYVRVEYAPAGLTSGKARKGSGTSATGEGRAARLKAARSDGPALWLHSVNIAEYAPAGPSGSVGQHAPTRTRKLLAHRREIARLAREVQQKGVTLVPLKIYFKNGVAKLLVGLAKGKTNVDKRQSIAKREMDRDIARAVSKKY